MVWDFNGLNYRDQIDKTRFEVLIRRTARSPPATPPSSTNTPSTRTPPSWRANTSSDAGQINLARGYARPIRAEHLTLPDDVKAKLLPAEQYKNAHPIADPAAWEQSAKALPRLWQENVIMFMQQ